jgi:hypothetical protein
MDDEYQVPGSNSVSLSASVGWGLAGLLIGCTLLISACTLMVFNVILFQIGFRGIPLNLAQLGGVIGVVGVACLGIFGVVCGSRGWTSALRHGDSAALGIAGTFAAVVGLIAWLIAGIDLLAILRVIPG